VFSTWSFQLPYEAVPVGSRREVDVSAGREVADEIHLLHHRGAEMLSQGDACRLNTAEEEAAVGIDTWHAAQSEIFLSEVGPIAVCVGDSGKLSRIPEAPAVVGTLEEAGIAAFGLADAGSTVGAAVQQHVNLPLLVARENDWLAP
jgi:hypothetical protein